MVTTIVFGLAFLGIIVMLGYKFYERKRQSPTFFSRFLSKFDTRVEEVIGRVLGHYEQKVDGAVNFITEEIPKQSKEIAGLAKDSVEDMYKSVIPNIRGTRILKATRNASAFLRDIKDHREKNGRGRIEDSL